MVVILATMASTIRNRASEKASYCLAWHEMQQIRQAVLQFREDTGYFPRQGPFASLASQAPAAWDSVPELLRHADVDQLVENPLEGTSHPLADWNADTARGWRGPYLSRNGLSPLRVAPPRRDMTSSAAPWTAVGVPDAFSKTGPPTDLATTQAGAERRYYLLVDLEDPHTARVVCLGPNGRWDHGRPDDLVLYIR